MKSISKIAIDQILLILYKSWFSEYKVKPLSSMLTILKEIISKVAFEYKTTNTFNNNNVE